MQDYQQVRLLGRGAYGQAVLVREKGSGLKRVIKEIDFGRLPEKAQKEARNEVEVLKALNHPHIVAYVDMFFDERRRLCIVMEFADGGDLAEHIKTRRAKELHFEEPEALRIFRQCCSALHFVHARKILHRDLKCGNIFLTKGGDVKLGDFGIAKELDETAAVADTMIGTPKYLAPEICNSEPYGMKADIWSLGVVLYEMLALEAPFTGPNLAALVMQIVSGEPKPLPGQYSDEAKGLVARMLEKEPDRRPGIDRILAMPMLRGGARRQCVAPDGMAEPREDDETRLPPGRSAELDVLEQAVDAAVPRPHRPSARASSAKRSAEHLVAPQARDRAQGSALQYARQGQRGRGADPSSSRSPAGRRQDPRGQAEDAYILALQEAASQSRRDREHVEQRRMREPGLPDTPADAARGMNAADRRLREAAQFAALQEAAEQSRRDRREVQQRMRKLERASSQKLELDCPTPPRGSGSDGQGEVDGPRRSCPLSKQQKEQEHLQALQEAFAQAQRDREEVRQRMLERERAEANAERERAACSEEAADGNASSTERSSGSRQSPLQRNGSGRSPLAAGEARDERGQQAEGNSSEAPCCDLGQGADLGAGPPHSSPPRLPLQQEASADAPQEHLESGTELCPLPKEHTEQEHLPALGEASAEALEESLTLGSSAFGPGCDAGNCGEVSRPGSGSGRRRLGGSLECLHAADDLSLTATLDAPGGCVGGERGAASQELLDRTVSMDGSQPRSGGCIGQGEGPVSERAARTEGEEVVRVDAPSTGCSSDSRDSKMRSSGGSGRSPQATEERGERRQPQRRLESPEGLGNNTGAFFCDLGQGADLGAGSPHASQSQLSLQEAALKARHFRATARTRTLERGRAAFSEEANGRALQEHRELGSDSRHVQLQGGGGGRLPQEAAAADSRLRETLQEAAVRRRDERRQVQRPCKSLDAEGARGDSLQPGQTQCRSTLPSRRASSLGHTSDRRGPSGIHSNRKLVRNALERCCLTGEVNKERRNEVLTSFDTDLKGIDRLIILFRSIHTGRHDVRALYGYKDGSWARVFQLLPSPPALEERMIAQSLRYDSGGKDFKEIPALQESLMVSDAVFLHHQYVQKSRVMVE